jgi:hypothetical protein
MSILCFLAELGVQTIRNVLSIMSASDQNQYPGHGIIIGEIIHGHLSRISPLSHADVYHNYFSILAKL